MPRNGKEGILFSFTMSALMIYLMAALNMYVRTALGLGGLALSALWEPWWYAVVNFPLAYVVGMICDLGFCTPASRKIMTRFCAPSDRPVWKGITVKFCMVVLMTIAMTVYGAIAAVGFRIQAIAAFFTLLPYNFIIALPIQMLVIAPLAGRFVHFVGDRAGWCKRTDQQAAMPVEIATAGDVMEPDVYTVSATSTVGEAMRSIIERNVSGMPVVEGDGRVVGFISDSDVYRALSFSDLPVSDYSTLMTGLARNELPESDLKGLLDQNVMSIATRKVVDVSSNTDVEVLCQLFGQRQLKKVPVVDNGKLVGIVNRSHLSRRALETSLASWATP